MQNICQSKIKVSPQISQGHVLKMAYRVGRLCIAIKKWIEWIVSSSGCTFYLLGNIISTLSTTGARIVVGHF